MKSEKQPNPQMSATEEGGGAEVIINCFTGYINCLKYSPNFFLAQQFFSCLSTFYITSRLYLWGLFLGGDFSSKASTQNLIENANAVLVRISPDAKVSI